jgi:hypothetical protein
MPTIQALIHSIPIGKMKDMEGCDLQTIEASFKKNNL